MHSSSKVIYFLIFSIFLLVTPHLCIHLIYNLVHSESLYVWTGLQSSGHDMNVNRNQYSSQQVCLGACGDCVFTWMSILSHYWGLQYVVAEDMQHTMYTAALCFETLDSS